MNSRLFFFQFVFVCTAVATSVVSGQQQQQQQNGGRCGIPLNVPGATLDPSRMSGAWYEYMYRTPGLDDFNTVNYYTPLCQIDGSPDIVPMSWTVSFLVMVPSQSCLGIFTMSNFTNTGKKNGVTWLPGAQTSVPTVYTILYTDYSTLEISHRCQTANSQTGMCDEPLFFVNTRVKPAMLSQSAKTYIQNALNYFLGPYCYSAQDLKFTGWNEALPACNPQAPSSFTQLIQSFSTSFGNTRSGNPQQQQNNGRTWGMF